MRLPIPISVLLFLGLASSLCYTPDGDLGNDVPCNPDNLPSVCCTAGFVCMSNGLCQPANWWIEGSQQFIRGTCTDKTWTAPQCHGYCVAESPTGGEWVMQCNTTFSTAPDYCCSAENCCSDPNAAKLSLGMASVTATAGASLTTSTTQATTTTTTGNAQTTALTSYSTTTMSAAVSSASLTSSTSAIELGATPTPSSTNSSSSNNDLALPIGLAVGLGVGAILLLGVIWFWFFRRRRNANAEKAGYRYSHKEAVSYGGDGKSGYRQQYPQMPELNSNWHGHQVHSESKIVELAG